MQVPLIISDGRVFERLRPQEAGGYGAGYEVWQGRTRESDRSVIRDSRRDGKGEGETE